MHLGPLEVCAHIPLPPWGGGGVLASAAVPSKMLGLGVSSAKQGE